MATTEETQSAEYFSARSRNSPQESDSSRRRSGVSLAPLSGDGRRAICLSSSVKRQHKDRRIYVNRRTGLPVRPPTSFGLFKHALRKSIKNDKVSFAEFNKLASEKWSKMNESEKSVYGQRAKDLADQYKKIEVRFLRKKVRQLQRQVKDYASYKRRY